MNIKTMQYLSSVCLLMAGIPSAIAQGTAFTYQGKLNDNGAPATGRYDLQFELHANSTADSRVAGPIINPAVAVSNGMFTTSIDFGSMFNGADYYLQIGVRSNGLSSAFAPLNPRQCLSATPYALYAAKAGTASSVASDSVTGSSIKNQSITAAKVAGGQMVKSLNGLKDDVTLQTGANLTLAASGNSLTVAAISSPVFAGTVSADALSVAGHASIGGQLSKLDVADNFIATVRAADFNLGHSGRRGSPGRALVDLADTLYLNFAGDWPMTGVGGGYLRVDGFGSELAYLGGDGWGNDVQIGSFNSGVTSLVAWNAGYSGLMDFSARNTYVSGDMHLASSAHAIGYRETINGSLVDGPFVRGWNGGALGTSDPDEVALGWNWQGDVWVKRNLSTCSLTIRGGCDLAEPFKMSEENIPKGAVVIIDEEREGHLKMSSLAYDKRVAGIVSGANGINPGISLHQEGMLEGGENVALSGRVYVQADASRGAIKPGDLLTASDTPGHAMKVTDHVRAQGAIIGKAMTTLAAGKGMVLVLVTLQ